MRGSSLSPHWVDTGNAALSGVAHLAISRSMGSEFNAVAELAGTNNRSEFVRVQRRGCVGQKSLSGRGHIKRREN
jgi:hypothetical protein